MRQDTIIIPSVIIYGRKVYMVKSEDLVRQSGGGKGGCLSVKAIRQMQNNSKNYHSKNDIEKAFLWERSSIT